MDFLTQMLMLLTLGYLTPLIELYIESFGLTATFAGLVFSIYTVCYFVTSIFESFISGLLNQKMLIALGIILTSISFLLISQVFFSHNL